MTRLLRCFVFVITGLSAGCGTQPYPTGLAYPPRVDAIVVRLPATDAEGPPPAGKIDEFIGNLNARGGKVLNPNDLPEETRSAVNRVLVEMFGSPAVPLVPLLDVQGVETLHLEPETLAAGSLLYKKHCLQCHGLSGDGRGPTGQWVYPSPRDFRQGIFKFVTSPGTASRKPSRADLHRSLALGIERTSMPPFGMLSELEREQIISYTIHLSLRGEVEYRLLLDLLNQEDMDNVATEARSYLRSALRQWLAADIERIAPTTIPTPNDLDRRVQPDHLESVRRGHQLFTNPAINCIGCHVDFGRQARYLYDSWGGVTRPNDLTEGVYRGGKTPLDLFQRIRGGVGPSGMPAAVTLSDDQTWDLVHFVLALPATNMLPSDVRSQVYPAR